MLHSTPSLAGSDLRQDRSAALADDGISRAELFAFARRNVLRMLGCMGLGIVAASLYVASQEPRYTAHTQILIDMKSPALLDTQGREVETSLDTAEVESQMTVLRSEMIASMVIDELGLVDDPEFQGQKASRLEMLVETAAAVALNIGLFDSETVAAWQASILDRDAAIEANDPGLSSPEARTSDTQTEVAAVAASGTEPAAPEAESAASTDGMAELDPDALDAEKAHRVTLAIFQSKLGVSRVSVSYVIDIAFSSNDPEKAARIANATADAYVREQLLSKIAAMEQGNEWLEARLNELRRKLNAATQAVQSYRARHDYSIPDAELIDPASIVAEAGANPSEAPTLEELEATADTFRKLYGSVLEAFTASMQHQSYPYSLVRVITPASPPFSKSSPRTKITLAFGALAGLLFGIGLAVVRQSLDASIRAPRQVWNHVGTDCIAEVPRIRRWTSDQRNLIHASVRPQSSFAKAIGRLKTAIRINAKADGSVVVGITSAMLGEGKSVVASNLGLACFRTGYRTLVVDGDPLRSTLSRAFLLMPETDNATDPLAPHPVAAGPVRRDDLFDLIPAPLDSDPDELARHPAQSISWQDIRKGYEVVIVDLPPIEQAIDVFHSLSGLDYLVIVAAWGETRVDKVAEAVRLVNAVGTPLLGLVLTKVRSRI